MYKVTLPPSLASVHNVFHVYMLRKFIRDPEQVVELALLELEKDLTCEDKPIHILDQREQVLRCHTICYVKVQWMNHSEREAT